MQMDVIETLNRVQEMEVAQTQERLQILALVQAMEVIQTLEQLPIQGQVREMEVVQAQEQPPKPVRLLYHYLVGLNFRPYKQVVH